MRFAYVLIDLTKDGILFKTEHSFSLAQEIERVLEHGIILDNLGITLEEIPLATVVEG